MRRSLGFASGMAESFVDSFKTELIRDRVWRSTTQLELAIVEWVAWFNTRRLHSSIANRPPVEHEAAWRARLASQPTAPTPTAPLLTANAAREYGPSGVVSEIRCQTRLADNNKDLQTRSPSNRAFQRWRPASGREVRAREACGGSFRRGCVSRLCDAQEGVGIVVGCS